MRPFSTPVKKAFIKGIPTQNQKNGQLSALQQIGSIGFGYNPRDENPIKVEFDAVINQTEKSEHIIAEWPIENGTFLSDNIVKMPVEVDLEVIFTDTPTSVINPFAGLLDTYNGRSADKVKDLKKIKDSNITVTIVTGLDVYKNMYLKSLTIRKDNNTGFAVGASMSFKEQRTVRQAGAISKDKVTEDVKHTVGVGDAVGFLTLLPLVV